MRVVGIVAEYNPFHAGHRFHLEETRRLAGDCAIVVVMSGNFVQRGDCAVFDKWIRARAALEGGADLVLELPTVWAAASAEHFAWGAVSLLREAGVQGLSFGSESADSAGLARVAACLDSQEFRGSLRMFLDQGLPFAVCRQRAAAALLGDGAAGLLSQPNDNLGAEYLKAARRLGWSPEVLAIPRRGAGHDGGGHSRYPSASWLRERILAGTPPEGNPASLKCGERGVLARLRAMDPEEFGMLPDSGEGLDRRLYRAVREGASLDEVYRLAKSKRYAHARIRRMVLWAALGLRAADRPQTPPYLRVLGANGQGRQVLKGLSTQRPVITKPAHGKGLALLELEAKCTDFYGLCRESPLPCGAEWTVSPAML